MGSYDCFNKWLYAKNLRWILFAPMTATPLINVNKNNRLGVCFALTIYDQTMWKYSGINSSFWWYKTCWPLFNCLIIIGWWTEKWKVKNLILANCFLFQKWRFFIDLTIPQMYKSKWTLAIARLEKGERPSKYHF